MFEVMDGWMEKLKKAKQDLPSHFDYVLVMKAVLKVCTMSDNSFAISRALWFIYRNICLFPEPVFHDFLEHLIGPLFIQLFTHWSVTVRTFFLHLLWYVILFLLNDYKCNIIDVE